MIWYLEVFACRHKAVFQSKSSQMGRKGRKYFPFRTRFFHSTAENQGAVLRTSNPATTCRWPRSEEDPERPLETCKDDSQNCNLHVGGNSCSFHVHWLVHLVDFHDLKHSSDFTCRTGAGWLSPLVWMRRSWPGQSLWVWLWKAALCGWPASRCPTWCQCEWGRQSSKSEGLLRAERSLKWRQVFNLWAAFPVVNGEWHRDKYLLDDKSDWLQRQRVVRARHHEGRKSLFQVLKDQAVKSFVHKDRIILDEVAFI